LPHCRPPSHSPRRFVSRTPVSIMHHTDVRY
jgi:hypothetical protein